MGKFVKSGIFAAIGSAVLLIAGCLPLGLSVDAARRGQPTFDGNAWVTYWDFEQGMKEAEFCKEILDKADQKITVYEQEAEADA